MSVGDFLISKPNPRTGHVMIMAVVKPHGVQRTLTRRIVKNARSRAEAEAWIRNHGSGWWAEHEAHSNAAQLGHLRRRGY